MMSKRAWLPSSPGCSASSLAGSLASGSLQRASGGAWLRLTSSAGGGSWRARFAAGAFGAVSACARGRAAALGRFAAGLGASKRLLGRFCLLAPKGGKCTTASALVKY